MIVRYSDTARELELLASERELYELSTNLEGGSAVIKCETEGVAVSPYPKLLSFISIAVDAGRNVEFQVTEDDNLWISGERSKLSVFAKVVQAFAKEWAEGEHLHVEYYDDHPYLSSASIPLVISHL